VGRVTADARLVALGRKGATLVDEPIADLKESWQRPLRW
jgi:hypothetical protein